MEDPQVGLRVDCRQRVFVAATGNNETSEEIVSAWRERGVKAELVPPSHLQDRLRAGDVTLARLDVLATLDGVEPGLFELLRIERRGFRVLNPVSALLVSHDKLRTARCLARAGLPHPTVTHVRPEGPLPLPRRFPVVVKPRFGSWGKDVVHCSTVSELTRCLDQIRTRPWFCRHGALVQELVPSCGYDIRVIVAGGRAVGAIERVAAPGEWRTNISLGGSRRPCIPVEAATDLAVTAAAAAGADLVGVDLLPTDLGYVVLELNGAVEFDEEYSHPGADIYADIVDALALPSVTGASAPSTRYSLSASESRLAGVGRGRMGLRPSRAALDFGLRGEKGEPFASPIHVPIPGERHVAIPGHVSSVERLA